MVNVGIIGAGFIGRNHYNQYEKMPDRARVVALCDRDAERRAGDWSKVGGNVADMQGTKRDLGGIKPYVEWKELLADPDVQMIDICAPTYLHRDIVIEALGRGKHVLCEKPMALSVEQCDEMLAAARKSGVKFMIAQCIRFWPEYVFLKQAFGDNRFGELRALHLRRQTSVPSYSKDNWIVNPELSGGAILDLHVHDVDFAIHLLGKPKSVIAQGYQRTGGGVDRVHALWQYRPNLVVHVEGYWDMHPGFTFNMGFTAVFEDASLIWDMKSGQPLMIYRRGKDPEAAHLDAKDPYHAEIEYFIGCIEKNQDPKVTTPQESRDAVMLALAEKQSALTGRAVEVA